MQKLNNEIGYDQLDNITLNEKRTLVNEEKEEIKRVKIHTDTGNIFTLILALRKAWSDIAKAQIKWHNLGLNNLETFSESTPNKWNKLPKSALSKPFELLDSEGKDFLFMDREESLKKLFNGLHYRYKYWEKGNQDKQCHPIAFLAAAPGTGKSRFLQELPNSFKKVGQYITDESFRDCITNARIVNISFNNDTQYDKREKEHSIATSINLRILYQIYQSENTGNLTFLQFYNLFQDIDYLLEDILNWIKGEYSCIVLAIDEINHVYDVDKENFRELFDILRCISTYYKPFFVPIFSGTGIEAIENCVIKSGHSANSIPLPLLSYNSCLEILKEKGMELRDNNIRKLIMDIGGHPRVLEYFYVACSTIGDLKNYDKIQYEVKTKILNKYQPQNIPLKKAIVYSYLSTDVGITTEWEKEMKYFMQLKELGIY